MDKINIKFILDRYFEGLTTLEEEQQLKSYFSSEKIDSELEEYRPLFAFFVKEKSESVSKDFEIPSTPKVKFFTLRNKVWQWGVAAAIVIAFSISFLLRNPIEPDPLSQQIDWSKYEPENDEQALHLTLAALRKTSSAMQKGTRAASAEIKEVGQFIKSFK